MLSGEATNTNFIVFGLTRPWLEPAIYPIRDEHASQYTLDVFHYLGDVLSQNNIKFGYYADHIHHIKFGYYADHIHPIGLEIRDTTWTQLGLLHILSYTSKMTSDGWLSNIPLFSFKTVFQTFLFPPGYPS